MKITRPSPFGSGFLIVDKPKGWTSFDVVAKIRRLLQEKTVGHLGTLDPLATGVLVVAVGRAATRRIPEFMKLDKTYEVTMELGRSSETYDLEGPFSAGAIPVTELSHEQIEHTLKEFCGETLQMPPPFSAKKIAGKKAYELARAGRKVELKPVLVRMEVHFPVEWISSEPLLARFTLDVSSGTYVRSLVHDLGARLGCGALLYDLRRRSVGDFLLEHSLQITDLEACVHTALQGQDPSCFEAASLRHFIPFQDL